MRIILLMKELMSGKCANVAYKILYKIHCFLAELTIVVLNWWTQIEGTTFSETE